MFGATSIANGSSNLLSKSETTTCILQCHRGPTSTSYIMVCVHHSINLEANEATHSLQQHGRQHFQSKDQIRLSGADSGPESIQQGDHI